MDSSRVIIFDLDPESGVGTTLHRLLESDPNTLIKHHVRGGHAPAHLAGQFSLALCNCSADAAFIVATQSAWELVPNILSQTTAQDSLVPFIAILDRGEPDQVCGLLNSGLSDFILTPLARADVLARLYRLRRHNRVEDASLTALKDRLGLKGFVGESPRLISEIKKIPKIASSEASVFIFGESGTGKELCARAIHYLSPRSRAAFVPVNCGAIPAELVENELFGHESGAFTGANCASLGLIQEAEGGTLFLDEVDSLPLLAQVKLLRFLQEREYRRLGSRKLSKADVRVLAATNHNVQEALASSRFRSDLYYRLNTVTLSMPPLRERLEDVHLLSCHLEKKLALQYGKPSRGFHPSAVQKLVSYTWPGNVRELENIIARAVLLSEEETLSAASILLPEMPTGSEPGSLRELKAKFVGQFERNYVISLLLAFGGNITRAAAAAHKNRRAFWELIRKYQITVPRSAPTA